MKQLFHNNEQSKMLEDAFTKARSELAMLSEITTAVMQSLEPEQVLYTILTALTSNEGLGFNRAMFFQVNEDTQTIEGKMGIGPISLAEADEIWHFIDDEKLTLQNLVDTYDRFKKKEDTELNRIVKTITSPLEDNGVLSMTFLEGMPFDITTEKARLKVNIEIKDKIDLHHFVTVPIKTRNRIHGVILVDNIYSNNPITNDDIRVLNIFAGHAALAIENSILHEKTVHLSRTDWLTGLWNSRYFNFILDADLRRSTALNTTLSFLMVDIDTFKKYNDIMGHPEGNKAIQKVSDILTQFSRKNDFVCRYGGEEFCIIMPDTKKEEALVTAERLRSEVKNAFKIDASVPENLKLTISLGLAIFPENAKDKTSLIQNADLALYNAKQSGKNKVCVYNA